MLLRVRVRGAREGVSGETGAPQSCVDCGMELGGADLYHASAHLLVLSPPYSALERR